MVAKVHKEDLGVENLQKGKQYNKILSYRQETAAILRVKGKYYAVWHLRVLLFTVVCRHFPTTGNLYLTHKNSKSVLSQSEIFIKDQIKPN